MAISYTVALLLGTAVYLLYRKFIRTSLKDIPGPSLESFWLGNIRQFFLDRFAAEEDFELQEKYGHAVRINATIGGEFLWLSDPKALQHIYNSGYNWCKCSERRSVSRLIFGHGIVWADGDVHRRQRKVLTPAFGVPEAKALLPVFSKWAEALAVKWTDMLDATSDRAQVVNVAAWVSRATLDAIGEAAFDYHFGTLDNTDNELAKAYNNMMPMMFASPSLNTMVALDLMRFVPLPAIEWLQDRMKGGRYEISRNVEKTVYKVAKELIATKAEYLKQGKGSRDVFSLIVKANASEDERSRLSDREMYDFMRTIMFAGHETTTNALSFLLLELARNPTMQTRLRDEIRATRNATRARGQTELTPADLEAMPYLQAVLKESLRLHTIFPHNYRKAARDDVLPLATPLKTRSGKTITEIPVAKGTRVILSIAGYNRLENMWGRNPHAFDPERWFDGRVKRVVSIGQYNNLLSFAGGVRGCPGWRFSLYELQAFIVTLISQFEFAPSEETSKVRRELCSVMAPTIEGDSKAANMPLRISLATPA